MSAHPKPGLTPQDYLRIERTAKFRSEFFDGQMWAMAGGSDTHSAIITNLIATLHRTVKGGPCRVRSGDLRVCVSPDGLYTYPDVTIFCEEPRFLDERRDTLLNPTLVIEVLSPSTEAYDRGFKATQYRTVVSLREHVLVAQIDPRVQVFRRQTDNAWLLTETAGLSAKCKLESIGVELSLADIYEGVAFTATATPPGLPA